MKSFYIIMILAFLGFTSFKPGKPAYLLFNSEGKAVKYEKMVDEISASDIILFGELHNNPIAHWLQLELTKDLYTLKKGDLILGAEMFETDNQLIMDEYLEGLISQPRFEQEARLWPNYKTDYKPLVEFAKTNGLKFVASNVPRRYASLVNAKGFQGLDSISQEALRFLPPLPVPYDPELEGYKKMLEMEGPNGHVSENLPKAQAIKDATMAYFILKTKSPGKQLIHFHGAYHSDNYEGIYWYLKNADPSLNIVTITTVSQKEIAELTEENTGKADYTICVDEDMTTTY